MKPLLVWQPTQAGVAGRIRGRDGVSGVAPLHTLNMMRGFGVALHAIAACRALEISRGSPPDAMCVEPAPWQFSHWIFETFCSAAGMAAKLPACKTVGAVQPNVVISWLNPLLGTVAAVSKPTVWQPQQALV